LFSNLIKITIYSHKKTLFTTFISNKTFFFLSTSIFLVKAAVALTFNAFIGKVSVQIVLIVVDKVLVASISIGYFCFRAKFCV